MTISEIRSLWVKTAFAFHFAQLHISMTENWLAFLFVQCARTSSLHWSTVLNLLVHHSGVLCNCRFRHSKQLLWNKTIITNNYLLWQPHVYLKNEWLEWPQRNECKHVWQRSPGENQRKWLSARYHARQIPGLVTGQDVGPATDTVTVTLSHITSAVTCTDIGATRLLRTKQALPSVTK